MPSTSKSRSASSTINPRRKTVALRSPTRSASTTRGGSPPRLAPRHGPLTDASGRVEHVGGGGVIGEQPRLRPGEDFRYTSGVMLGADHGTMQGDDDMVADDGTEFAAPVAPFVLAVPRTLH